MYDKTFIGPQLSGKQRRLLQGRLSYAKHRAEIADRRQRFRQENPEVFRGYRNISRDVDNARKRAWRKANPEKAKEKQRLNDIKYRAANRARKQTYYIQNRDTILARCVEYSVRRRKTDPIFRLKAALRTRVHGALKRQDLKKNARTEALIGCSTPNLRAHLEKQFRPGMSWENYGLFGWHVDHKTPCASFDLRDPEQVRACFNYANLQPLWRAENLEKSDRV